MIHIPPRLVVKKLRGQSAAVISDYPTSSRIIPIQKKNAIYTHKGVVTVVTVVTAPANPYGARISR